MKHCKVDMASWRENRYRMFNSKIDYFKAHSRYQWLRQYADDAIRFNSTSGYSQIKAEDFIKRIEGAPLAYIQDWLDGKNQLEWSGIKTPTKSVPIAVDQGDTAQEAAPLATLNAKDKAAEIQTSTLKITPEETAKVDKFPQHSTPGA